MTQNAGIFNRKIIISCITVIAAVLLCAFCACIGGRPNLLTNSPPSLCILRMHRRTRNRTGVNDSTGTAHAFRRTDCGDDDKTFGSRNKRSGGGYRG